MKTMLQHLWQRWSDWCGDRDMEIAIRKQLTKNGFYGTTAKLRNVRLVAVQRPGWLQVFRFEATARVQPMLMGDDDPNPPPEYRELFGLIRDDIRHEINSIEVFESESDRRDLFALWSDGLIRLRGAQGIDV